MRINPNGEEKSCKGFVSLFLYKDGVCEVKSFIRFYYPILNVFLGGEESFVYLDFWIAFILVCFLVARYVYCLINNLITIFDSYFFCKLMV